MSHITAQDNIRYCIDKLSLRVSGCVASAASAPVNLARASRVYAIAVGGNQPPNTYRYFAFKVGGKWGKLSSTGTFLAFAENSATFDNLEQFGNISSDLSVLSDVPALAGQSFGIAIALASDDPDNAVPTAALTFRCVSDTQQLTAIEYSPVYDLGQDSQIISTSANISTSNGGAVDVTAQYTAPNGSVSGWLPLESIRGKKAQNVQFRANYSAATQGSSVAQLKEAAVICSLGKALVSGTSSREIISQTINWYMPIHSCRLTVKHDPLTDAGIQAFVAFRDQSTIIRGENLGVGTGSRKTYQLAHTSGIKYDTLKLYFDSAQVFTNYELNSEVGRVTCTAPEGVIISCDYEYGWDAENWQSMRLTSRYNMDSYDVSEFRLTTQSNMKSAAALKIVMNMTSGHINNETLGTGTGKAKSFKLSHIVNDGKISITAGSSALSAKNWTLLDDPQYVSIAAPSGQVVKASYDWVSESPKILQFSAVFAE